MDYWINGLLYSIHSEKPINERQLAQHDGEQERPDQSFTQPQTALACRSEPELKLDAADGNDVTVVKQRRLNGLAVDHDQGILCRHEFEALPPVEFERQVLIPGAIVGQLQVASTGATNAERKTADNRLAARLFSCQNVKFNH